MFKIPFDETNVSPIKIWYMCAWPADHRDASLAWECVYLEQRLEEETSLLPLNNQKIPHSQENLVT